jgi:hypothetical protein
LRQTDAEYARLSMVFGYQRVLFPNCMKTNEPTRESLDQVADVTVTGLAQAAAGPAFDLFRDKQFCRLTGMEELNSTEQDRIFNELVVASVVPIMLLSRHPIFV